MNKNINFLWYFWHGTLYNNNKNVIIQPFFLMHVLFVHSFLGWDTPPNRIFWLWELAETSDGAEIYIRWDMGTAKLNGIKKFKNYQGALPPALKFHNPKAVF